MPTVRIPSPLRRLTAGRAEVEVAGADVRSVIAGLETLHPGLADRLLDVDGGLHHFVNVFVGEHEVRTLAGLDTSVAPGDTVSLVPAVAGGA